MTYTNKEREKGKQKIPAAVFVDVRAQVCFKTLKGLL